MSRELDQLCGTDFMGQRIKSPNSAPPACVSIPSPAPTTCITCDDVGKSPNRIFNFYQLKHMVEDKMACKDRLKSIQNEWKDKFMATLETSLDNNGIKGKVKNMWLMFEKTVYTPSNIRHLEPIR